MNYYDEHGDPIEKVTLSVRVLAQHHAQLAKVKAERGISIALQVKWAIAEALKGELYATENADDEAR